MLQYFTNDQFYHLLSKLQYILQKSPLGLHASLQITVQKFELFHSIWAICKGVMSILLLTVTYSSYISVEINEGKDVLIY